MEKIKTMKLYPNRGNGFEIVRDEANPCVWRVNWMGKLMSPIFVSRLSAYAYFNKLRALKRMGGSITF
jgi:hypothetical protein